MREWIDLFESPFSDRLKELDAEINAWKPPRGLQQPRPEDIEMFRKLREALRIEEGGGGMCHFVSEWIEYHYGWRREGGVYVSRDGEVIVDAHYWNVLPDGSILDATADQTGEGKDIAIIPPNDPDHGRYAEEWYDDWHPQLPHWKANPKRIGVRKPEHFTGKMDYDLAAEIQQERGPVWWVTHPDQYRAYLEQQLRYAEATNHDLGINYTDWIKRRLDALNKR